MLLTMQGEQHSLLPAQWHERTVHQIAQKDAPHFSCIVQTLLKEGDSWCCWLSTENVRQLLRAQFTEILRIPEWNTFFYSTGKCRRFSPVPIEYLTLIFDPPAWLIFLRPEAEIQGIQKQHPVDGTLCPIIEVIAIIPGGCGEGSAFSHLLYPLIAQEAHPLSINPDVFSLLHYLACTTEYT